MTGSNDKVILENRHTGERLEMWRVTRNGETWLAIRGSLPPHRKGPPLHVHYRAEEEFRVISGTMSALGDGRQIRVAAGETATFPAGSVHTWWNDGDEIMIAEGYARPAGDLDRHLQAAFDVINSSPAERPSPFYMAHITWRHRRTQAVVMLPRPIQAIVIPLIVLLGTLLGHYRGSDWPGSPGRCRDAPLLEDRERDDKLAQPAIRI
jgi:mannose-6-phosphate isomerase-like protein (cupin superfamily)